MTTFERFERSIPELMTELAPARVPDYFDDMLRETASHGQRPAWSFPERCLPMETSVGPCAGGLARGSHRRGLRRIAEPGTAAVRPGRQRRADVSRRRRCHRLARSEERCAGDGCLSCRFG